MVKACRGGQASGYMYYLKVWVDGRIVSDPRTQATNEAIVASHCFIGIEKWLQVTKQSCCGAVIGEGGAAR